MKATVELPDDLVIAAKKRAAELRRPLRDLIEQGLRTELGRSQVGGDVLPRKITWVTVEGGCRKESTSPIGPPCTSG